MRLLEILRTIAKYRLAQFLPDSLAKKIFGLMFFWQAKIKKDTPRAVALHQAIESLGPVFIKLGQLLSVRRDLLPKDIADELSKLQDAVPPDSWQDIQQVIKTSFGDGFFKLFKSIDEESVASASIAQVHNAVDTDGNLCVIKVVRPGIEDKIKQDMKLARFLAKFLNGISSDIKRMRLPEVMEDYDKVIHDELDLLREAANMSALRRNFADSDKLQVPAPDWDRSSEHVLTMERISGIPVGQIDKLQELKVNLKKLGELGVDIFFTQVFRDNLFHADMHPGNIFVNVDDPENPSYIAVDFGIMGSLSEQDKVFVAESLLAFFNSDYAQLAKVYIESGWVRPDVSEVELQAAFRTVLEPVANRPISEISLGKVLLRLFKVSKRFGMEIQPQLVLLDKTLLYIEGVGKQLYPELDLWNSAKPYLEKWMSERLSLKTLLKQSANELPKLAQGLPQMPKKLHKAITRFADGDFAKANSNQQIIETLIKNQKKTSSSILNAAGAITAGVLLAFDKYWLGVLVIITWLIAWMFSKKNV